ncbi:methyltransferase domain-containing protein [Pararhizobium sp. LjRoot238]|uniref:methyltransferase domain-containing protein n=1 Tax=Pararhizobium sp. LjRoot238 TaxID=3342293 RepID=UPI003ECF0B3F
MAFYNLSEKERIALTERAITERRTVTERWSTLEQTEAEPWKPRARIAARLLGTPRSVLDLGCGVMALEELLPSATTYYPVDVVSRDSRTIVCDFNNASPPRIKAEAVTCLGLLEYLFAPEALLNTLSWRHDRAVISYCITDAPKPVVERRAHAWVNGMSSQQVEALFHATGWNILQRQLVDQIQMIWLLERKAERRSLIKSAIFELKSYWGSQFFPIAGSTP